MTDEQMQVLVDLNHDPIACHLWMQRHVQGVERPNLWNVAMGDDD